MRRFMISVMALVSWALTDSNSVAQSVTKSPRRQVATSELREAKRELDTIRDDRTGRVKDAIKAIDRAIASIDLSLTRVGETPGIIGLDPDRYPEFLDHVPIRRARHDLEAARDEMTGAQGDQWGLRKSALQDIQTAIDVVKELLPPGK
jgi:hypothetical protein